MIKQEFIKGREESIYESITHLEISKASDKEMKTIGGCKWQLGDYATRYGNEVTCKRCKRIMKGKGK